MIKFHAWPGNWIACSADVCTDVLILRKLRELDLDAPLQAGGPSFISAASGLAQVHDSLFVVADDELSLAQFGVAPDIAGIAHCLLPGELPLAPDARKKSKPDFEALVALPAFDRFPHGALLVLGSGSKHTRHRGVLCGLDAQGAMTNSIGTIDLAALHAELNRQFEDLNLEGAAVVKDKFVLFQRGNKQHKKSAAIYLALDQVLANLAHGHLAGVAIERIQKYSLDSIEDIPFAFTDGIGLPNGEILFSAVAEDTSDSYQDGACRGALIGLIDTRGNIVKQRRLSAPHKIEGLHAEIISNGIRILAVTDGDDRAAPAQLLTGSW